MGTTKIRSWRSFRPSQVALKYLGLQTKNLLSIRKKLLLFPVSSEYKDLAKFTEDTDSHLFGEELEDSLKMPKEGIVVCRYSNLRQTTLPMLQLKENSTNLQKRQVNQKTHG